MSAYTKKKSEVLARKKLVEDFINKKYSDLIAELREKGRTTVAFPSMGRWCNVKRTKDNRVEVKINIKNALYVNSLDEVREKIFVDAAHELWHLGIYDIQEHPDRFFRNSTVFVLSFL